VEPLKLPQALFHIVQLALDYSAGMDQVQVEVQLSRGRTQNPPCEEVATLDQSTWAWTWLLIHPHGNQQD
jgi:hypothetical protein